MPAHIHSYLIILADKVCCIIAICPKRQQGKNNTFIRRIIYLFSQYNVPGTMLGPGDATVKQGTTTLLNQGISQERSTIKMSDHANCPEEKLSNIRINIEEVVVLRVKPFYRKGLPHYET